MFINGISVIPGNNRPSKISFGQGEIKFWTDFDGTLFPANEDNLSSKRTVKKLKKYFEAINNFFSASKGRADCHITTGRNFISFNHIFNKLKNNGIAILTPSKLVTSNGKDVFVKPLHSNKPITYKDSDKSKQKELQKLTNWDIKYIRSFIVGIFKDLDIPLGQPMNVNPDIKEIIYPVLRNDGDLQIDIDLPKELAQETFIKNLMDTIKQKLNEKNISYDLTFEDYDPVYHRGPSIIIVPKLKGIPIDKSFDIREALKKAENENDLVIVAGDYKNDYNMLDPANYAKTPDEMLKLPMRSIVVGNNPTLAKLAEKYPDRVLITKEFHLLEAIKQAIVDYTHQNPDFKLKPEIQQLLAKPSLLSRVKAIVNRFQYNNNPKKLEVVV